MAEVMERTQKHQDTDDLVGRLKYARRCAYDLRVCNVEPQVIFEPDYDTFSVKCILMAGARMFEWHIPSSLLNQPERVFQDSFMKSLDGCVAAGLEKEHAQKNKQGPSPDEVVEAKKPKHVWPEDDIAPTTDVPAPSMNDEGVVIAEPAPVKKKGGRPLTPDHLLKHPRRTKKEPVA